jgi:hypothetical protein
MYRYVYLEKQCTGTFDRITGHLLVAGVLPEVTYLYLTCIVGTTNRYRYRQCFGSGSTWIRIQLVAWIRIRILNADPGGLKRAKMKKKNAAKRHN